MVLGAEELKAGDADRIELGDIVLGGPGTNLCSYGFVGGARETTPCALPVKREEFGDIVLCTFGGGRGGSYAFNTLGRNSAAVGATGGLEA